MLYLRQRFDQAAPLIHMGRHDDYGLRMTLAEASHLVEMLSALLAEADGAAATA